MLLTRLLITWLTVWPLVTVGLIGLQTAVPQFGLIATTFILTGLLVPVISLAIAPQAARLAQRVWASD
jgi:hypothetical protein